MDTENRRRRRGHQEGAIYQRGDGRWVGAVHLGYDANGKRLRRTYTGKTRTIVARKVEDAVLKVRQGLPVPSERVTVEEYLTGWLRDTASVGLKESTLLQYQRMTRIHVLPSLGKHRLARLNADHLQQLYAAKLAEGLAPATVTYIHRVIHRALDDALRRGYVFRNVAALTSTPPVPKSEALAFTGEQARKFIAAVRGDPLEALYILALSTGLRRGELLALQWADVDLEAGHVSVRRAMTKIAGGWAVAEPKSASSRRVVKLTQGAIDALQEHRGDLLPLPSTLVFTNARGLPIDGRNLLREFKVLTKRAGLGTDFTFHSLRHSTATLMLVNGEHPRVVMEALGHSRVNVTMDIYSHVQPHLQAEAAKRMDVSLFGAR